jgi:hypothetical protein
MYDRLDLIRLPGAATNTVEETFSACGTTQRLARFGSIVESTASKRKLPMTAFMAAFRRPDIMEVV